MSRTRKDRPYWVRCNNVAEEGRYINHNHEAAGKAITKRVRVHDENGDKAFSVTLSTEFVGYTLELKTGITVEIPAMNLRSYNRGFSITPSYNYGEVYRTTPRYETRSHNYAKYASIEAGTRPVECTEDIPIAHDGFHYYNSATHLCYPELARYVDNSYRHNRPQQSEKRLYHSAARNKEQGVLRKATVLYNSGEEDLWSDDVEDAYTRPHRHTGWWD